MLASTEQRLKEIVFFLHSGLNLLDKETKHELNIKIDYENYFGRHYIVIKFSIPNLTDLLLITDKKDDLISLMRGYKIETLDNINIGFKIKDINDSETRDEWMRSASVECESIVSVVKNIFEVENVFIAFQDNTK